MTARTAAAKKMMIVAVAYTKIEQGKGVIQSFRCGNSVQFSLFALLSGTETHVTTTTVTTIFSQNLNQ